MILEKTKEVLLNMYIFNKIKVNPQLPKQIKELETISNNLWWSWNTEYLKIFKNIDIDLWEKSEKNPVKFLKLVDQEKLEKAAVDQSILKQYKENLDNFTNYMLSKNTWFNKEYPENTNDVIAYFSAEYGLDETIPIYSGGLRHPFRRSLKICKRFRNSTCCSRFII